jgi:hypothetical protein
MRPSRKFGRLFFDGYSASDPFDKVLNEAISEIHKQLHPYYGAPKAETITLSRVQAERVQLALQSWVHYGGHPSDDESICKQLTEVRKYARTCKRPEVKDDYE